MKEEKQKKIKLSTIIILFILLVCIVAACIIFISFNNNKYINNTSIKNPENNINDENIAKMIDVDFEEFNKFKNYFIGANIKIGDMSDDNSLQSFITGEPSSSKKIEFKNDAEKNFKILETYILNSDKNVANVLLDSLKDTDLYVSRDAAGIIESSENLDISSKTLDNFYIFACSGLIKHYFNFNNYDISVSKIEQYNGDRDIAIYMTINNKFFVIFEYDKSECYFLIYNGTKYNENKESIVDEHIGGYDSLKSWYRIETMPIDAKPIIYLYPTEDTELSVKLGYKDKITCSYPIYRNGWNVLAKPNGDLIDLNTNRNLYSLYYESETMYNFSMQKDGFVVKGTNVAEFLEEKLAVLGLTERESEEFIIYWLPILQKNEYNYIRFATIDEINKNMPLEFSKEPDTLIRVLMTYKGLDEPIQVEEQQLQTPKRTGFVAVEWGGTEIK